MATGGADAGSCSRTSPCATLAYAITRTSATTQHIVVGAGAYSGPVDIGTAQTSTPKVWIHGSGASFSSTGERSQFAIYDVETTLVGMSIGTSNGFASYAVQCTGAPCHVRHVRVQRTAGFDVDTSMTVEGCELEIQGIAISATSSLSIKSTTIRASQTAIQCTEGTCALDLENVLLAGTQRTAVDAPLAQGSIRFTTIVTSGDSTDNPRAVRCGVNLAIRDSIVWAPNAAQPPIGGGCSVTNSIAGPTAVPGAMSSDPLFVGLSDFHLTASSPAKDKAVTGPTTDFEGESRPAGGGYDLGADEVH